MWLWARLSDSLYLFDKHECFIIVSQNTLTWNHEILMVTTDRNINARKVNHLVTSNGRNTTNSEVLQYASTHVKIASVPTQWHCLSIGPEREAQWRSTPSSGQNIQSVHQPVEGGHPFRIPSPRYLRRQRKQKIQMRLAPRKGIKRSVKVCAIWVGLCDTRFYCKI